MLILWEAIMNIGIVIHTQTGTTRKFANLISGKLIQAGHQVTIMELTTNVTVNGGTIKHHTPFEITNQPDVSGFDAVCIGAPVWAFGESVVIHKCINSLVTMKDKPVIPFVTMGFPLDGMGGKTAIAHMSEDAKRMGAKVLPGSIVNKMFRNQAEIMEREAARIVALLKA